MSELGKMEEGRAKDMDPYQSPRKAEAGLGSDRLPQELREFTPASKDSPPKNGLEIRSSSMKHEEATQQVEWWFT